MDGLNLNSRYIKNLDYIIAKSRNLCLAALTQAARETQKMVTTTHVNHALIQPHWRSSEQLLTQQSQGGNSA